MDVNCGRWGGGGHVCNMEEEQGDIKVKNGGEYSKGGRQKGQLNIVR